MVNYKISPQAEADLYCIWLYGLEHWGIVKADQYQANFFERFKQLANQPFLYVAVENVGEGYRRSVCGTDSIFYRIDGDDRVEIMAIIDQQDLDKGPF